MRRYLAIFASLVLVPVAVYACGDDDTAATPVTPTTEAGTEASTTPEAGKDSATDTSVPDTSITPAAVRCTQAEFDAPAGPNGGDYTAFPGVDITFPMGGAPEQYKQRCAKVKVGSDVTFSGNFAAHPLEASGGDVPSPVPTQSTTPDGGALTFKVPNQGRFGYQCNFHPSSMFGAILVVP